MLEGIHNEKRKDSSFPKNVRLRNRIDFLSLQKRKKTFTVPHAPNLVLDWMMTSLSTPRLGITVTRKNGSSVQRNLFKRRAREAFRQSSLRQAQVGVDFQIRPRSLVTGSESPIELDAIPFQSFVSLFEEFNRYILSIRKRKDGEEPRS